MKTDKFTLKQVRYMPKTLEPGVLYVSKEFETAAHLCACGCGSKVRTPLGPAEWSVEETGLGPSLHPSVGNWQLTCRSHYWICQGVIQWAPDWTPEQVEEGRHFEDARRRAYFESLKPTGFFSKVLRWFSGLFD